MAKLVFEVIRDYLLPIILGGLIGGLLVGAFYIWPTAYGAQWWEAFTALGTVGAVVLALFQDLFKRQESNKRLQGANKEFARKIELERRKVFSILIHRGDSFEVKSKKIKKCLLGVKNSVPQALIDEKPSLASYIQIKMDELISLSEGGNSDSMSDYDLIFREFKTVYDMEMQELSAILRGVIPI